MRKKKIFLPCPSAACVLQLKTSWRGNILDWSDGVVSAGKWAPPIKVDLKYGHFGPLAASLGVAKEAYN